MERAQGLPPVREPELSGWASEAARGAGRAGRLAARPLAALLRRSTAFWHCKVPHRPVAEPRWVGAVEPVQPVLGMTVAFRPGTEADLADVPARVVAIWPRLRSGAYLVTLEYLQPIACHHEVIQQVEAFMSELYQPPRGAVAPTRRTARSAPYER